LNQKLLQFIIGIIVVVLGSSTLFFLSQNNAAETIILATTTSTDNSGLLDYIHPIMTEDTGINIDVVAVGTGAALEYAKGGLADVVIVHAHSLEDEFIQEGYGIHRIDLMFNDFIIVGPPSDPANLKGKSNASEVFSLLYLSRENITFVSRGDNSGTHVKELTQWRLANHRVDGGNKTWAQQNPWYLETGSGMGQTLTSAWVTSGYTLTDRGTWLFNKFNLNFDLEVLAEGAPEWMNPYGAILVNPESITSRKINFNSAKRYVQWLISDIGQNLIGNYTINGHQAFFPDFKNHLHEMAEEELTFWGVTQSAHIYSRIKALKRRRISTNGI
jgi:tungstate transport system substrate-binding protein